MLGYLQLVPVDKQVNITKDGEYHEQLALSRFLAKIKIKYGDDYKIPNPETNKIIKDYELATITLIIRQLDAEIEMLLLIGLVEDAEINEKMIDFLKSLRA